MKNRVRIPVRHLILAFSASARASESTFTITVESSAKKNVKRYACRMLGSFSMLT